MDFPGLDDLDLETRTLLALAKLDQKDPLTSTVREVAREINTSHGTARKYLALLRGRGYVSQQLGGRPRKLSFRCTVAGANRANQLRLLKPRQRLIFQTLRRLGEGHMHSIAKAAGLDVNGVSQSLPAMADRELIKPVYNAGRSGWVYAA